MANAKEAIRQSGKQAWIGLDMGPTGKLLKPMGDLAFEDCCAIYREVVEIGADAGADFILIETMSDSYETKAAVLAAKEGCDLPIFVTVTFDERGKLLTGGSPASIVAMLEGLGVDVLGMNCGLGPVQMKEILKDVLEVSSIPVMINPNAGLPRSENGKTVYDIDAAHFAKTEEEIVDMGARIVGGCCGTTPEHIRMVAERCRDKKPVPVTKKNRTVVSSFCQAVEIGKNPVIIGERINPTGKSKFKQALRDHNLQYILQEGVTQQDHGAHVLDVNVGLPEIDEPSMLEEVVRELQSIIDLPLQLDTTDPVAMERAMRVYNGKPLINSVNGKEESMRTVFPLVQKYGGVVVALALDEGGIPETAEGRIQVAKKIYKTAAEYGIGPEDIIIDALCLTVSSDSQGAITTLETLRRVRDELHGKTILGVSNTPSVCHSVRSSMRHFSPCHAEAKRCHHQSEFRGHDARVLQLPCPDESGSAVQRVHFCLQRAGGKPGPECGNWKWRVCSRRSVWASRQSGNFGSTCQHREGIKRPGGAGGKGIAGNQDALEVINSQIIPALDVVGKGFEKGTMFLPQLLMSAEAAKGAFGVIKEKLDASGQKQEKKGKIILATVKGDIHDIGKNIVKVLLENYSYDVLDLGKDVPPETIVETAVEKHIELVGLSALMTTTVPSMEETIVQLRKAAPWAKVMVGGAVLTQEYADTMGADQYCRDAMASVNYAEQVFGLTK